MDSRGPELGTPWCRGAQVSLATSASVRSPEHEDRNFTETSYREKYTRYLTYLPTLLLYRVRPCIMTPPDHPKRVSLPLNV